MVALDPVLAEEPEPASSPGSRHLGKTDVELLKGLIERHRDYTGSTRARAILDDFEDYRRRFVKVMPHEYRRALGELAAEDAAASAGVTSSKTVTEAVVHG